MDLRPKRFKTSALAALAPREGCAGQARNLRLAFKHFNESAFGGSSDGMFNLASMPAPRFGGLLGLRADAFVIVLGSPASFVNSTELE